MPENDQIHNIDEKRSKNLLTKIQNEISDSYYYGRLHNRCNIGCSIIAILLSYSTTVFAALPDVSKLISAISASLAGVFLSIPRVIGSNEKASWYFSLAAQLKEIEINLDSHSIDIEEAAKKFGETIKLMEKKWGIKSKKERPNDIVS
jgi:hypothetical protein